MIEGPEGLKRVGALHVNSLSFPFSNSWRPGPARPGPVPRAPHDLLTG
jgi:hypothetical protein